MQQHDPALSAASADTARPATRRRLRVRTLAALVVAAAAGYCAWALAYPQHTPRPIGEFVEQLTGANAHPVHLQRPATAPLSAMAQLGKRIYFDQSLSASGRMSCASCHSAEHAYGPANPLPVQFGGPSLTLQGDRPPPSLMYLYRQPNFGIGPDQADADEPVNQAQVAQQVAAAGTTRAQKTAGAAPAAPEMVPQGGLFWDGRVDTLQDQALGPLLNPVEMANTSVDEVTEKFSRSAYRDVFIQLFGPDIFKNPRLALSEAMFAVARFQVEDPSFHPYSSKYDYWLEGRARLTQAELRGLRLFNDPHKANCAGCHLSKPGKDGLPPMFTDYQYESLGVPRNPQLAVNRDANYYDMGLCGPHRTDLATQTQYCGMFLTPTLRNSATRKTFFHNGVYRSLDQVMAFYNLRDIEPGKIYPHDAQGHVEQYDDLPAKYRANIDKTDAPFDRKLGDAPSMTQADIEDIIAFLKTLTDGYRPDDRTQSSQQQ
ncbi:cytochrome-c peroxidase [Trinickia fusca]|uniref:Cytochrome-c peroxidase n=1 Tax=Trinickia fusca TaxID=2419777 RepID=A0A494XFQ0_9BURK|nr:cytochrome-c peroxidase [Trinickia fusca]